MLAPRRKLLLAVGAIVLVVLILVGLPVYLTMRPGYFDRYPALASKYETFARSTHSEARCEQCHVSPSLPAQGAFRVRMLGAFYVSLVTRKTPSQTMSKPTNAACLSCHESLRSVSPKGDLRIPHRAHVEILKMDCVQCHGYLVHEKSAEGKNTPAMADCLTCHDGDTAKNSCDTCHTNKAAPATHKASDWTIVHAKHRADEACVKCHGWTKDWCADCHARRPRSHGADWRATHGEAVAKRRTCEACHDTKFCIKCHGELPKQNLDPTLQLVK